MGGKGHRVGEERGEEYGDVGDSQIQQGELRVAGTHGVHEEAIAL